MGFFSFLGDVFEPLANVLGYEDETISAVAASSVRMYADEVKDATVRIIYDHGINGKPLITGIRRELYNGSVRNLNRFYEYGNTSYTHGLPTTTMTYTNLQNTAVDSVLTTLEGEPITSEGIYIALPSASHIVQYYLQENSGYSLTTNKVVVAGVNWEYDGYSVNGAGTAYIAHLSNVVTTTITITNEVTIATAGGIETTTTFERNVTTVNNGTSIEETIINSTPVITEGPDVGGVNDGIFSYPLLNDLITVTDTMDFGTEIPKAGTGDYYTVLYHLDSIPNVRLIWLYQISLGTYPTLAITPPTGEDTSQMLPVVPLRQNFVTVASTGDPELGIPENAEYETTFGILNLVSVSLKKQIETLNSNEHIEEIEDAFIHFGIPVYTQTDPGMEALFEFFSVLALNSAITKTEFDVPVEIKPTNVLKVVEGNFDSSIKYNYILDTLETGTIGEVGDYTNTVTILPDVSYIYYDPQSDDDSASGTYPASYITLQRQLTETTYAKIIVHGLVLYHAIRGISDIKLATIILSDVEDNQGSFIIPLGLAQLNDMRRNTAASLIRECCHMTFYARKDVFVAWYKSAGFLSLVGVVFKALAIISILSGNPSATEVLWNLGKAVLTNAVLGYLLVEALEHSDNDFKKAAAITAYVYAVMRFGKSGSTKLSPAAELLKYVTVTTTALSTSIKVDLEQLGIEQDALDKLYEEQESAIQAVYDEYNPDKALEATEVYAIVNYDPNESIDAYYSRVAHTGNPGVQVLSEIEDYVSRALELPEVNYKVSS